VTGHLTMSHTPSLMLPTLRKD